MMEFAPTPKEISPVSVQTSGPEKHATRVGYSSVIFLYSFPMGKSR